MHPILPRVRAGRLRPAAPPTPYHGADHGETTGSHEVEGRAVRPVLEGAYEMAL